MLFGCFDVPTYSVSWGYTISVRGFSVLTSINKIICLIHILDMELGSEVCLTPDMVDKWSNIQLPFEYQ